MGSGRDLGRWVMSRNRRNVTARSSAATRAQEGTKADAASQIPRVLRQPGAEPHRGRVGGEERERHERRPGGTRMRPSEPAPAPGDARTEQQPGPDVHDEERVAVVPLPREGHEEPHAVGVEQVEQRMAEHADRGGQEQRFGYRANGDGYDDLVAQLGHLT